MLLWKLTLYLVWNPLQILNSGFHTQIHKIRVTQPIHWRIVLIDCSLEGEKEKGVKILTGHIQYWFWRWGPWRWQWRPYEIGPLLRGMEKSCKDQPLLLLCSHSCRVDLVRLCSRPGIVFHKQLHCPTALRSLMQKTRSPGTVLHCNHRILWLHVWNHQMWSQCRVKWGMRIDILWFSINLIGKVSRCE